MKEVDGAVVIGCPCCHAIIAVKSEAVALDYSDYLPTEEQLTYTIHCLLKQKTKLSHALKQVHATITKLEVLRELAKENTKGTK
jgi:hypothetical protein